MIGINPNALALVFSLSRGDDKEGELLNGG